MLDSNLYDFLSNEQGIRSISKDIVKQMPNGVRLQFSGVIGVTFYFGQSGVYQPLLMMLAVDYLKCDYLVDMVIADREITLLFTQEMNIGFIPMQVAKIATIMGKYQYQQKSEFSWKCCVSIGNVYLHKHNGINYWFGGCIDNNRHICELTNAIKEDAFLDSVSYAKISSNDKETFFKGYEVGSTLVYGCSLIDNELENKFKYEKIIWKKHQNQQKSS